MTHTKNNPPAENYNYWPIELLTDYVLSEQEHILNKKIPEIRKQFRLVCEQYSKVHPGVTGVSDFFMDTALGLRRELSRDADTLFPYIRELAECHRQHHAVPVPAFSSLGNTVRSSRARHLSTFKNIDGIIEMAFTFNKFKMLDKTYAGLINNLNVLQDELQTMVHLKFDILFARAIEMENTVGRSAESRKTSVHHD